MGVIRIMNNEKQTMQPYQQRVIEEKEELDLKIDRLFAFRSGSGWEKIPVEAQKILNLQYHVMVTYSLILELRIKSFNAP